MRQSVTTVFVALVGAVAGGACERERSTEPPMTPAARITPAAERAADDVALARCDREERCERVGEGGYYVSREHCLRALLASARSDLGACAGIDQAELPACAAEIRAASCEDNIDRLDRIAPCDRLCVP